MFGSPANSTGTIAARRRWYSAGLAATRAPLLVNGYSLVASAGVTSVLGVLFWMVATHHYTPEEVGLGAALISSMTTIGYLAQLNFATVLNRFLQGAGARAGVLVLRVYAIAVTAAVVLAVAFSLEVGHFAEPLRILRDHPMAMAWFVASAALWTVFALQDAALAGLRKSVIVPIENTAYAVAKILILVALATAVLPPLGGVYLAWTVTLVPIVLIVNYLIFRRLLPVAGPADAGLPDIRTLGRFMGWDYVGSLALAAALGLAPLLVLSSAGVAANASYHVAWQFAYSVYLIGRSMSISLVAEGAADPDRLRRLTADTLLHAVAPVALAVAVLVAGAPWLLLLFGESYAADGTAILRVLAVACLPWAVTTVYIAHARARGRTRSVAVVQVATLLVFVAASAAMLGEHGALAVALGWLVAHMAVFIGIVSHGLHRGGASAAVAWALALSASAARFVAGVRAAASGAPTSAAAEAQAFLLGVEEPEVSGLRAAPASVSASDGTTVLLSSVTGEIGAVMKSATSPSGIASLRRNVATLRALEGDPRLDGARACLPRVIGAYDVGSTFRTIETAVPGVDGRRVFRDRVLYSAALHGALTTMADLHRRTGESAVLDEAWAGPWIDGPVDTARLTIRGLMTGLDRAAALDGVRAELRQALLGRTVTLGLGHGDFSPGNILFRPEGGAHVEVSGLVDWDAARTDAPFAVDACHLTLTAAMLSRGDELGPTVCSALAGGWPSRDAERLWTAIGSDADWLRDPALARSMILLTWLHHISANLTKSERYGRSRLWIATNIDLVLTAGRAGTMRGGR